MEHSQGRVTGARKRSESKMQDEKEERWQPEVATTKQRARGWGGIPLSSQLRNRGRRSTAPSLITVKSCFKRRQMYLAKEKKIWSLKGKANFNETDSYLGKQSESRGERNSNMSLTVKTKDVSCQDTTTEVAWLFWRGPSAHTLRWHRWVRAMSMTQKAGPLS